MVALPYLAEARFCNHAYGHLALDKRAANEIVSVNDSNRFRGEPYFYLEVIVARESDRDGLAFAAVRIIN